MQVKKKKICALLLQAYIVYIFPLFGGGRHRLCGGHPPSIVP